MTIFFSLKTLGVVQLSILQYCWLVGQVNYCWLSPAVILGSGSCRTHDHIFVLYDSGSCVTTHPLVSPVSWAGKLLLALTSQSFLVPSPKGLMTLFTVTCLHQWVHALIRSGKLLLALAGTFILASRSCRTHDHIFLYYDSGSHGTSRPRSSPVSQSGKLLLALASQSFLVPSLKGLLLSHYFSNGYTCWSGLVNCCCSHQHSHSWVKVLDFRCHIPI
jgi:hypothetical protein